MSTLLANYVLDNGLSVFADADTFYLCSDFPTSYGDIAGYALGSKTGTFFGAPTTETGVGRKVSSTPITDGTVSTNGTAAYAAVTDESNTRWLASFTLQTNKAVATGMLFTLPSFDVIFASSTGFLIDGDGNYLTDDSDHLLLAG